MREYIILRVAARGKNVLRVQSEPARSILACQHVLIKRYAWAARALNHEQHAWQQDGEKSSQSKGSRDHCNGDMRLKRREHVA